MNSLMRFRFWLMRRLAMGAPIVMNVKVNGLVGVSDPNGIVSGCHLDGTAGSVVLEDKPHF